MMAKCNYFIEKNFIFPFPWIRFMPDKNENQKRIFNFFILDYILDRMMQNRIFIRARGSAKEFGLK